jgi:hypothetical protein
LERWAVALLRSNASITALLFPAWAPSVGPNDLRVFGMRAFLPPGDIALRESLPRLSVETRWTPSEFEQEQGGVLQGAVALYLYVTVPEDQEEYGDKLIAAAILLLLSTHPTSVRMIAAGLALSAEVTRERISAFKGAWQYMAGFRSANVGVTA